jgi:transcriptional regulator PpsR
VNKNGAFLSALDSFSPVDSHAVKAILAAGSDIALLVGADGIVQDVYLAPETQPANDVKGWSGRGVYDIVTEESREKISDMLARARSDEAPRWREINHVTKGAEDFPVRYAAVPTGEGGKIILLGRDLRMVAQLQQRLVQAQLTMEQDYERIRQIETRYRVLFETTQEALLIVSAETGRILDANSAAARLFSRDVQDLTNRVFANRFDPVSQAELAAALSGVRETGRERSVNLRSRGDGAVIGLDVLLFRSVNETLYLCRMTPRGTESDEQAGVERSLGALYRQSSDAIVFTDGAGVIQWANTAFLSLADVALSDTVKGTSFGDFLGRPSIDLNVMTTNARAKGRLSVYATSFRSAFGVSIPVEISTTFLPDARPEGYGFVLRDVSRASPARGSGTAVSSEAVEHIIDLVGSTPLKELVRGTTDVVEKLCIETAIKLTNNNRASSCASTG